MAKEDSREKTWINPRLRPDFQVSKHAHNAEIMNPESIPTERLRNSAHWVLLAALSALLVAMLRALHFPAAVLLGCMAAAILTSASSTATRPQVPPWLFLAAQGMVGCMIARSIRPGLLGTAFQHWPLFIVSVAAVISASTALGWLLMRRRVLPGTTAVWGLAPGAATAMTILADSYDADGRLVAFMQYLRVVLVTVVASAVSHLWMVSSSSPSAVAPWFPPIAWNAFAVTLVIALAGPVLARWLKIPAGALLVPMVLGIALQGAGLLTIELPPLLLTAAYALVGWSIGLRFDRAILRHAAQAFPRVLASIFALIVICMGFAALLVFGAGIDPLTAYLATSPGGADSVAIIAASSHVDLPFVIAMQTSRFLVVLLIGPTLARFIADRAQPPTST
jgi:membrane AbrB-like protein